MTTFQTSTATANQTTLTRFGTACAASGVFGILLAILSAVYPPAVSAVQWSYPYPASLMLVVSILLAVTHLLTLAGFVGVRLAAPHRGHRLATVGLWIAIAGFALLAVSELASGAVGAMSTTSPMVILVSSAFGVASLLIALGCIVAGMIIAGAVVWRGLGRWMVLGSGLILLVLVTPANIIGNEILRVAALALWSATFIPLGLTIRRSSADAG